jgi:hypothetical protein
MYILMSFFKANPINTPGITDSNGKKTGPNNNPNSLTLVEKIKPIVTKYAAKTKGRNKNGEITSFPFASFTASHIEKKYIEKKYKQG